LFGSGFSHFRSACARALGDESFAYQARPRTRVGAAGPERVGVAAASGPARPWLRDPRSLVALVAILGVGGWGVLRGRAPAPASGIPFRVALTDFEARAPLNSNNRLAISRDGSLIAVTSFDQGVAKLFVRGAGQREFREIPGTDGATAYPGFSPDGRWLVFPQGRQIKRVEVAGGPILPVTEGSSADWGLPDLLVFQGPDGGIYRIAPSGGEPVLVTPAGGGSRPRLLPDGKAVVQLLYVPLLAVGAPAAPAVLSALLGLLLVLAAAGIAARTLSPSSAGSDGSGTLEPHRAPAG